MSVVATRILDDVLDAFDQADDEYRSWSEVCPEDEYLGDVISVTGLAYLSGWSRTSVRNALQELEQRGLVRCVGQVYTGTRAQHFTASQVVAL